MRAQRTPPRDFYPASHLCVADDYANQIKILAPYKKALRALDSGDGEIGPGGSSISPEGSQSESATSVSWERLAPSATGNARDDEAEMLAGAPPRLLR
jgi:hypothetical protein